MPLTCAYILDYQVLRHIGIVSQQLLGVFRQAVSAARCQVNFTNFFLRTPPQYCSKPLIFLDIPPFFSLAVYFFALIFIFTADDLGSSPFSIIKESSFNLFLCCAISLQNSISIFPKNPAYLWFFHQKQKFDPTRHQQPEKIGVKNAMRLLLKRLRFLIFEQAIHFSLSIMFFVKK